MMVAAADFGRARLPPPLPPDADADHFDAWLSTALKREHAAALSEPVPEALLRLLEGAAAKTGPG
jgi:hypothetical protein